MTRLETQEHHLRRATYNHTRGDSPAAPCEECARAIQEELSSLRSRLEMVTRDLNDIDDHRHAVILECVAAEAERDSLQAKLERARGALVEITRGECVEGNGEDIGSCFSETPLDLCEVCRGVALARTALSSTNPESGSSGGEG